MQQFRSGEKVKSKEDDRIMTVEKYVHDISAKAWLALFQKKPNPPMKVKCFWYEKGFKKTKTFAQDMLELVK